MKITTILSFATLLLSGITSCHTSTPQFKEIQANDGSVSLQVNGKDTLMVCSINTKQETIDIPLSELIEDCRIIRLDNSDEALFKAWYITITDNHIGIRQSSEGPFKLFNAEGKYLCDVGAIGNGPGEYAIAIYDEMIDEENGQILLTSFFGKKIIMYGLDGKWIKDITLPGQINKAKIKMNPERTLSVLNMPFSEEEPFAFQMDMEGNILKKYPTASYMKAQTFDTEIFSYQNSGKLDLFNTNIDTLFHYDVTTNRLLPRFTVTFSGMSEKPMHTYTELPQHYIINYFSWEKGLFIPGGTVLIDKQKQASTHFRLVNDFFGNLPVDNPNNRFNKGWFIDNLDPGTLKEKIAEHIASGKCPDTDKKKLQELAASLQENDNNVLFVGKLKQ